MKCVRIIAMAIATMGGIHIAATFTPLVNAGLEVLSPAKQQAMTYMSLMCGMLVMDLKHRSVTYYSRRHFDKPLHFELTNK